MRQKHPNLDLVFLGLAKSPEGASMSTGPSFDDVPASAAPNKHLAASYAYRDRSRSPVFENHEDQAARPSLDSPYQYAKERWRRDTDMNRTQKRDPSMDLPPLQAQGNLDEGEIDTYEPISDDDPTSYDLVGPSQPEESPEAAWNLEKQSQALFSREHLQIIFGDPNFLLRFTSFLGLHRPQSVPILVHYLDSLKALRAIHYSNAILEGLDEVPGLDFTKGIVQPTTNGVLLKRATDAFDYLVREELPAYITHEYIQIVSASITARISGMLAPHLREASEGLAEVFCLTDPSRPDNPIVFASEGMIDPPTVNVADLHRVQPHNAIRHELHPWSQLSVSSRALHQSALSSTVA